MKTHIIGGLAAATLLAGVAAAQGEKPVAAPSDALPINQIQVVGTHNSYAIPADPRVTALMAPRLSALIQKMGIATSPAQRAVMEDEHPGALGDMAKTLDYVQMPLQAQLRSGVRSLEIDMQPDPKGGAYADPLPYLVRTRADIDTVDARKDDGARRDAALASGAQIVSTDYLTAPNIYANGYHLAPFAHGWRCNNVVAKCAVPK